MSLFKKKAPAKPAKVLRTADLLSKLGDIPDTLVTLDFETSNHDDYTLSRMTNEEYIRDPRFQVIGVGVKVNDAPASWMSEKQFRQWVRISPDWSSVAICCHHSHFDAFILNHHFGVVPGFIFDTLCMSRAINGPARGNDLGSLAVKYGVGEKGHEVETFKGKRLEDFTEEEWLQYGEYCKNDVELTRKIFFAMAEGFPDVELWSIDTTVRSFTEPKIEADIPLLTTFLADEQKRKAEVLAKIGADKKTLSSGDKFADMLRALDVEPPMKASPKQKNEDGSAVMIYAFAKSDPGMQELLEHPRDEVRFLAEARIEVKSTINETRTGRLLGIASRGPVPVYLIYCLAAETLVLARRGWVPIVDIELTDQLWDGIEWVQHSGVVGMGTKEVWEAHGIAATPDHQILTSSGWTPWADLLQDPSGSLIRSALSSATLPSSIGGRPEPRAGAGLDGNLGPSAVDAGPSRSSIADTSARMSGRVADASNVARTDERNILTSSRTQRSGPEYSRAFTESSHDARTQNHPRTRTTAGGVSGFGRSGSTTASHSFGIFRRSPVGIVRNWISTALTMTVDTSRAISGSLLQRSIRAIGGARARPKRGSTISKRNAPTFDVAYSGPRNRFTIWTASGPMVAHNCGAHTHRYSGGGKMNFQNFPRGGTLRKALLAPKGNP